MLSAEHKVRLLPAVAAGTAAAVGAALLCYLAARLTGDELLVVARSATPEPVPVGAVVAATAVGGLAAAALALLARRLPRPRAAFLGVTTLGTLVSFVPPVQAAQSGGTAAWLVAMHLVVAAAIVPAVASRLPRTRAAGPTAVRGGAGPGSRDPGRSVHSS